MKSLFFITLFLNIGICYSQNFWRNIVQNYYADGYIIIKGDTLYGQINNGGLFFNKKRKVKFITKEGERIKYSVKLVDEYNKGFENFKALLVGSFHNRNQFVRYIIKGKVNLFAISKTFQGPDRRNVDFIKYYIQYNKDGRNVERLNGFKFYKVLKKYVGDDDEASKMINGSGKNIFYLIHTIQTYNKNKEK